MCCIRSTLLGFQVREQDVLDCKGTMLLEPGMRMFVSWQIFVNMAKSTRISQHVRMAHVDIYVYIRCRYLRIHYFEVYVSAHPYTCALLRWL